MINRLIILVCLLSATPAYADLKVAAGTYSGNAGDNRTIDISDTTDPSIADFTPKAVFVKCDNTSGSVWSSDAMPADTSLRPTASSVGAADMIQSFVSNGFTIGTNAAVNDSGITCWYLALGGTSVATGSYSGNDTDNTNITTSPAIQPVIVFSQRNTASSAPMHLNTTGTDSTCIVGTGIACAADKIQAFNANGFQVGNAASGANVGGSTYYYITIASVTGQTFTGTFTGDTNDDRDITAVGFQPDFVLTKGNSTTAAACARFEPNSGDDSLRMSGAASIANAIQSFLSNGFQVGQDTCANENTVEIRYFALKSEVQASTVRRVLPIFLD